MVLFPDLKNVFLLEDAKHNRGTHRHAFGLHFFHEMFGYRSLVFRHTAFKHAITGCKQGSRKQYSDQFGRTKSQFTYPLGLTGLRYREFGYSMLNANWYLASSHEIVSTRVNFLDAGKYRQPRQKSGEVAPHLKKLFLSFLLELGPVERLEISHCFTDLLAC